MGLLKSVAEVERVQKRLALSLLKTQEATKNLKVLKELHVHLIKAGLHQSSFAVGNFVGQCATLGLMGYASRVFDQMLEPNSFVWNTMIRGFQQNQEPGKALLFFHRMQNHGVPPDCFSFPFVIRACADSRDVPSGCCIHGKMFKTSLELDVFAGTSMMEFYSSFGDVNGAHQVFDEMPIKDAIAWTVIISSCVNHCVDMKTAHMLFDKMPLKKDVVVWNTMIAGYVKIGDIGLAKMLFDQAPFKDLLMYNTMLGGYAKHGGAHGLLQLFDEMPERDLVSWNSVIGGLVQNKRINEAMVLFHRMQLESFKPNEVTLVNILSGCAQVGALDTGRWIHSYIDRNNLGLNAVMETALVDMYSKCGDLDCAQYVFDCMLDHDVVAWNAMIMGLSMNGQSKNALKLFYQMKDEHVRPNETTFIAVLCACTHAGLVDEGRRCFHTMCQELGLTPRVEHYGCMVDLLGRAGLLNEAYDFIKAMPLAPHAGVWGALLGACKIHGNVEIAEHAIRHLVQLDPEDGGYLAIMSNVYANARRWDGVAKVRELMRKKGVSKLRGCSSIEVNGEIHEFGVEEKIHPRAKEIYEMIDEIANKLRIAGYVSTTSEVFFDVEEEEKERALFLHSEKLALAFGLISTEKGAIIRIVKNLRVCNDCHAAIKLISKIFEREIVIRDRSRFHHFRSGSCSCGDYW